MQNGVNYFNDSISDKIINDPKFRNSLVNSLKVITSDGKIDQNDIPEMIIMVIDIYNNMGKFKLTSDDFVIVMSDVVSKILDEYKLIDSSQKDNINKLINTALKLAVIQVKFVKTNCKWNCFKPKN